MTHDAPTPLPASLEESHQIIEKLSRDNEFLKHELAQLKRMVFGQKSERFEAPPEEQQSLELFPGHNDQIGLQVEKERVSYERRKPRKGHGRNPIPDNIYTEEVILEPTDADKRCACCGEEKACIGNDITKELDYKPAVVFARKFIRPKYVCKSCPEQGVTTAALPPRPIDRGIAGPGLLSYVLISKFADHLPLYRLEEIFKRYDIAINRSTMVGWIAKVCEYLEAVYDRMREPLLESDYLQSDETPLRVQDRAKKKKCHLGYLWPYTDGKQIVFDYREGRGREGPVEFLEGFKGYLQTDGYAGYNEVVSREGVTHAMCWAHARRKFIDGKDADEQFALQVLVPITKLYAVEKYCRRENMTPQQRYHARRKDVPGYLEELKQALNNPPRPVLPNSVMGNARNYILSNWEALTTFMQDGRIEIDNNRIENAIRPVALGRKNWLFAGSQVGAKRMAIIYSLVGTCKMNDINPFEYFRDILPGIADHNHKQIDQLTPLGWKADRESGVE